MRENKRAQSIALLQQLPAYVVETLRTSHVIMCLVRAREHRGHPVECETPAGRRIANTSDAKRLQAATLTLTVFV